MSDLPPTVASWRDEIERLSEQASLCRYLAPAKWKAMRENALAFIDQHGAEAHQLGWTAPELFRVHPSSGTLRVDSCGVLMLGSAAAQAVHADRIAFAQTSGYRFLKGQVPGVPVWEFATRALISRLTFAVSPRPSKMMRYLLAAILLAAPPTTALASEVRTDGPVVGGSFGMGGSDYYGDVRDRMPFTREAAPHPIGIREMERVRAARRHADIVAHQVGARRHLRRQSLPQG